MSTAETKPRDLSTVLADILGFIPKEEDRLIEQLLSLRDSVKFSAPELMPTRWSQVMVVLKMNFPPEPIDTDKLEPWQRSVIEVFTDRKL